MKSLHIVIPFLFIVLFAGTTSFSQDTSNIFLRAVTRRIEKEYKIKTIVISDGKSAERAATMADVCPIESNATARRILTEYGAIYVSVDTVSLPPTCIFEDETAVSLFQSRTKSQTQMLDGTSVTLQDAAMNALLAARAQAAQSGLRISPRGGTTAAKRTYEDTERLWESRFLPGLAFWVKKGRLKQSDADAAKRLTTEKQIEQVLEWESKGMFFSKDLSKSILYSVAAPGASQHISMLAMDVEQFADKRVRAILADNGWFQTVKSDLPHFTYLGLKESDLPSRGLKKVAVSGQDFWIPDFN